MKFIYSTLLIFTCTLVWSQKKTIPFTKIDSSNFKKINSYALRGEMGAVFEMLKIANNKGLTKEQLKKKKGYYDRFLNLTENFEYNTSNSEIIDMFKRFKNYWRSVIIEEVNLNMADSLFRNEMNHFLKKHYKPNYTISQINKNNYTLFKDYFKSKNLYGIAMGKTGHLYDLYLWKDEKEVIYDIDLPEGVKVNVPVVFMRNFISNGWSHYTTFGHSFSGGWTTKTKLFCVEEAYGPKDEEGFLISYVSHEGQHFSDNKTFPKLKQPDLEHRAKLTELSLSKKTTFKIINKFLSNAKNDKKYAHAYANYMVIHHLSKSIFKINYEESFKKWESISIKKINQAAMKILKNHSKELNKIGAKTVKEYITTL